MGLLVRLENMVPKGRLGEQADLDRLVYTVKKEILACLVKTAPQEVLVIQEFLDPQELKENREMLVSLDSKERKDPRDQRVV